MIADEAFSPGAEESTGSACGESGSAGPVPFPRRPKVSLAKADVSTCVSLATVASAHSSPGTASRLTIAKRSERPIFFADIALMRDARLITIKGLPSESKGVSRTVRLPVGRPLASVQREERTRRREAQDLATPCALGRLNRAAVLALPGTDISFQAEQPHRWEGVCTSSATLLAEALDGIDGKRATGGRQRGWRGAGPVDRRKRSIAHVADEPPLPNVIPGRFS